MWEVNLNPTRGHEQAGRRPALVVSVDRFNHGPAGLVVVLPITTTARGIPFHVPLGSPEGGVRRPSFIKCEDVRSIARERLIAPWGSVSASTMNMVEDRLRILLDL
ncbi:MAG: type II toxin-antitoxin system PemK/MazF family toxin [Chloroflexi bacterium]|nr:type II toxin-antitoxin system PemK/MazF family toxin [Chloroflexota bacterium]